MTTNDVAKVYDTILSMPGMGETVKIDLRVSRRNVLLLSSVIERGLSVQADEKSPSLLGNLPDETLQELRALGSDCLQKAGLTELSEKLSQFGNGK
jgi:hypothetical protein